MAYIFEYYNRLSRSGEIAVPAVAHGWRLTFESVMRDGVFNKRYIHPETLQPASHVARPNLMRDPRSMAYGACFEIKDQELQALDRRHHGLTRVELDTVTGYKGWDLDPSTQCYAYMDISHALADHQAVLPAGMLNQTLAGIRQLNQKAPGILKDWQKHTQLPSIPVHDLYSVHVSDEGKHLWMGQDDKQFSILLIEFLDAQFPPKTDRTPFEFNRHPDKRHRHLDFRLSYSENQFERRALWGKFLAARDSLLDNAETVKLLSHDPCWLVRLALANNISASDSLLAQLGKDSDPWVARSARIRAEEQFVSRVVPLLEHSY